MAKKNSTKTATKESYKASEPKQQQFMAWNGMNIQNTAPGWDPLEGFERNTDNQDDLDPKQWLLQNNMVCTDNLTVETRHDTVVLGNVPYGETFSGTVYLHFDVLYAALSSGGLVYKRLDSTVWYPVTIHKKDSGPSPQWSEITSIGGRLVCLSEAGYLYTGTFDGYGTCDHIWSARYLPNSLVSPSFMTVTPHGDLEPGGCPARLSFCYSLSNRYGNTVGSSFTAAVMYSHTPVEFNHERYLTITVSLPGDYTCGQDVPDDYKDVTGVDIYCHMNEAQDAIFIGHVDVPDGAAGVTFDWLGGLAHVESWPMSPLTVPQENMTAGPVGRYAAVHDDRLWIWGSGQQPWRIWYGGNPGNPIQFNRGTGAGWVDVGKDEGVVVKDIMKFKTYNATILTILADDPNTGKQPRYNLVEHNMTITQEIAAKGWFSEKVDNVIGSKSRWANVTIADGLYTIGRYGIGVTTMQASTSVIDRTLYVSAPVEPVFSDRVSERLERARMLGIDDKLYLNLAEPGTYDLDRIIIVYDINLKAFYTFTHESLAPIKHIFALDHVGYPEGIGVVTAQQISLIKLVGEPQPGNRPPFDICLETPELSSKKPLSAWTYVDQIELRFDYLIGDGTVYVDSVDYYGRRNRVKKVIGSSTLDRNRTEWIKVGVYAESYSIQIKGRLRMRLSHINVSQFTQSTKIGQPWGYDSQHRRLNRHGGKEQDIHHYIEDYNNLRDALVP